MFIWDFVADTILGQIVDWIYGQVMGFLGNFFAEMGNMGVELFELSWVQSIVLFFSYLAWALYVTGLVVACFECGIEYSSGRGNLKETALCAIKGFMAVSLFTVVPVRLYELSVTLQAKEGESIMIYATGDTHGNFQRFAPEHFPEQAGMTKEDYMLICGDFGGVWDGGKKEERNLDWLEELPFTTLFVSGNHENFDLLRKYPTEEWNGGKIQRIRPHVIHLMRGQVFDLQGYSFFTMGGARSHDIEDGILNPQAPDFEEQYWALRRMGARFRVNHRSWWKQELPSKPEYEEARRSLERIQYAVDYVITHCAPTSIVDILGNGGYVHDHLTDFLEEVKERAKFHYWLFGHYHDNKIIDDRFVLLWEQMVQVV